jgi:hypothetical protein
MSDGTMLPEQVVRRLFGDQSGFIWRGPGVADIVEVLPGTLYTTAVHRDNVRYDAQLYLGLGRIGGQFWEQDVHVLLRIATLQHPALPRVEAGGYSELLDAAFVVTSRAPYNLQDSKEARAALGADKQLALTHFEQLADALSILHGQGLLHRNIWPGTIRFTDGLERLVLSRFEMSALIDNVLRGAGDAQVAEQRRLFLSQPRSALLHSAPERLDELLADDGASYLETGANDVFALGMLAASWFLGDVTIPAIGGDQHANPATVHAAVREFQEDVLTRVRGGGIRGDLPAPLAALLADMLHAHPPSRPTAFQVTSDLLKHRDAILGTWEGPQSQRFLVLFMPAESRKTLYTWGELASDPSDPAGDGANELQELIDADLRRGTLAYSPRGAQGWVTGGDREALTAAQFVLVGARFAWFCQRYRPPDPVTKRLGEPWPNVLIIMFVTEHIRIPRVRDLERQRSLPPIEVARWDQDPADLATMRRGRPSWQTLIDTTIPTATMPDWQRDWVTGFDWLLQLRRAEMTVSTFPFSRESIDLVGRSADLAEDSRQRRRILSRSDVASELAAAMGHPTLGDQVDDADLDDEEEDDDGRRVVYWEGDRLQPRPGQGGRGTAKHLDPFRVRVTRDDKARPVPSAGMLRPTGHEGTQQSLRRQELAVAELATFAGLLGQFRKPHTIRTLRQRWPRAGEGLWGGADEIVVKMLTSQPFFALHGPPGTGKTTVVAHAVAAQLAADSASRLLISAQSNAALNHIGSEVLKMLRERHIPHLPLRIVASKLARDLPPEMDELQLEQVTEDLAQDLVRHADRFGRRSEISPELRELLFDWKREIPRIGAELRDRVRKGANLVFATCEGATAATLGYRGYLPPFNWVIIEEAAKAWPTEIAIPLVRATRWTLIGDHRQLPAHRREEVEAFLDRCANSDRPSLRELKERLPSVRSAFDLFRGLFEGDRPNDAPLEMLTHQFRMRRSIAEVVSRAFYDGLLKTDDSAEEREHGLVSPSFLRGHPLVWLDTTGWDDDDEPYWRNAREAELVSQLVKTIVPQLADKNEWREPRLAVLTPYHAQRRVLEELGVNPVHTVHSFQGSEAEIIVVSLVRKTEGSNPRRSIGHLSKPEVANVLLSRARRLLVLVGGMDHFRASGSPHWEQIGKAFADVGHRVSWRDSGLVRS